jgi:hypothetical protein
VSSISATCSASSAGGSAAASSRSRRTRFMPFRVWQSRKGSPVRRASLRFERSLPAARSCPLGAVRVGDFRHQARGLGRLFRRWRRSAPPEPSPGPRRSLPSSQTCARAMPRRLPVDCQSFRFSRRNLCPPIPPSADAELSSPDSMPPGSGPKRSAAWRLGECFHQGPSVKGARQRNLRALPGGPLRLRPWSRIQARRLKLSYSASIRANQL